jgi:hypothetical protein
LNVLLKFFPFPQSTNGLPRPRDSLDRRAEVRGMVNHEIVPAEIDLKLAQERLRQLEQELKIVREIAEEALRVAKRAKRELSQHA